MINNDVKNWQGQVIGFRCSVCDEIKTKMWGTICNACRKQQELIDLLKLKKKD